MSRRRQSLLLLMITLIFGLRENYTLVSKIETVLIGLLGTFLVNLARLTLIVILLAYSRPLFAVVYHDDYLAAIVTILWLFGFWWFVYSFVLEEKTSLKTSDTH